MQAFVYWTIEGRHITPSKLPRIIPIAVPVFEGTGTHTARTRAKHEPLTLDRLSEVWPKIKGSTSFQSDVGRSP